MNKQSFRCCRSNLINIYYNRLRDGKSSLFPRQLFRSLSLNLNTLFLFTFYSYYSLLVARTLFSCSRFNAILSQLTEDKLERADVHKRHNLAEAHLVHGHSADAEQLHALPDLRLFGS